MKTAVIRVDGAPFMGIGHIMRCLTLADTLVQAGWASVFVCREFENHYCDMITAKGFELRLLPAPRKSDDLLTTNESPPYAHWLGVSWQTDCAQTLEALKDLKSIDLLIVDHYGIDWHWHEKMRGAAERIFVIDDLADRPLDCDFLLDQTYGRMAAEYSALTPQACRRLCGSEYTLLRDEFSDLRERAIKKARNKAQNIFISMGGGDPLDTTGIILRALESLDEKLSIAIILSSKAPHLKKLKTQARASHHDIKIIPDCKDVAAQMLKADVAFGAGGTTSWERCCLGLPALIAVLADNQDLIAEKLAQAGAVINLGSVENIDESHIRQAFIDLASDSAKLDTMARSAAAICDGQGKHRVLEAINDTSK